MEPSPQRVRGSCGYNRHTDGKTCTRIRHKQLSGVWRFLLVPQKWLFSDFRGEIHTHVQNRSSEVFCTFNCDVEDVVPNRPYILIINKMDNLYLHPYAGIMMQSLPLDRHYITISGKRIGIWPIKESCLQTVCHLCQYLTWWAPGKLYGETSWGHSDYNYTVYSIHSQHTVHKA